MAMQHINRTNSLYFIINNLTWLIRTALSAQEYLYLHGFSLADPNYKADL